MRTAVSYYPPGVSVSSPCSFLPTSVPKGKMGQQHKRQRFKQSKNKQASELNGTANVKINSFCGSPRLKRVYVMWGTALRAGDPKMPETGTLSPTGVFGLGMCVQFHEWDATSFNWHTFEREFYKGRTQQHCTQSLARPEKPLVSALLWHKIVGAYLPTLWKAKTS